jgi:hypothetical protein
MRALKVLIVVMGVLLLLLTGLRVWCLSYKCTDPKLAEQIEQETISKLKRQDREAEDVQTNGWGDARAILNIAGATPDPAILEQATGLKEWCHYQNPHKDLKKTVGSPEFKKAMDGYLGSQPMLDQIFSKPNFSWPSQWEQGLEGKLPSFVTILGLFKSGSAYAAYLKLQHQPAKALELLLNYLELSDKLDRQGYLTTGMFAATVRKVTLEDIQDLLLDSSLTTVQLNDALERLNRISSPIENFRYHMDVEYVGQMQMMKLLNSGRLNPGLTANPEFLKVASWFGYLQREQRALQNWMLVQRPAIQGNVLMEEIGQPGPKAFEDLISSSHSVILPTVAFNSTDAQAQILGSESMLNGTRLECAMVLYRREHRVYPTKLDALCPKYFKELPRDWTSQDKTFVYEAQGDHFKLELVPRAAIASHYKHSRVPIPPDRSNP